MTGYDEDFRGTTRTSGVNKRTSGVTKRTSGVTKRISGVTKRTSGVTKRTSGVTKRTSGVTKRTSGVTKRTSGVTKIWLPRVSRAAGVTKGATQYPGLRRNIRGTSISSGSDGDITRGYLISGSL